MKVLEIIHTTGHGGAENIFRWLAWNLRKEGIEVVAGIPADKGPRQGEYWIGPALEELGVPCRTFVRQGSPRDLVGNLISLVKGEAPDIVHSHLLDASFYSSIACRWLSIPHVCTEHGDVSIKGDLASKIKLAAVSMNCDAVVCVSETVRRIARRRSICPSKFELIYNGIRPVQGNGSSFRREIRIPDGELLVGNIANLYPVKGQHNLICAFAGFLESFPESTLVIVGRGAERHRLEDLVSNLRIPAERVLFTGFRKDVENILQSLDIYVQPSLSEGLPVALLEAMSAGVPVIATRVGGMPEVIGADVHGVLVPPGSPESILEGMRKIAGQVAFYKERAKATREYITDNFSLDAMTGKYIELYRKVLAA